MLALEQLRVNVPIPFASDEQPQSVVPGVV
jgi:hypothetical protein